MSPSTISRTANAILGAWLFVSARVVPRSIEGATTAGVVGSVTVAAAIAAVYAHPRARWVNVGAAMWLLGSTLVIAPRSRGAMIHDAVLAVMLFAFALVPAADDPRVTTRGRA